jgi:hypothetical protein
MRGRGRVKTPVDRSFFAGAPKGLRPPAQGCRFGYPGSTEMNDFSTATRLRHLRFEEINKAGATALRLRDPKRRFPRVAARRGNPGLEVVAPFGAKENARAREFSTRLGNRWLLEIPHNLRTDPFSNRHRDAISDHSISLVIASNKKEIIRYSLQARVFSDRVWPRAVWKSFVRTNLVLKSFA